MRVLSEKFRRKTVLRALAMSRSAKGWVFLMPHFMVEMFAGLKSGIARVFSNLTTKKRFGLFADVRSQNCRFCLDAKLFDL